jgi:hypothetical protein
VGLDGVDLSFIDSVGQLLGYLGYLCLADVALGDGD